MLKSPSKVKEISQCWPKDVSFLKRLTNSMGRDWSCLFWTPCIFQLLNEGPEERSEEYHEQIVRCMKAISLSHTHAATSHLTWPHSMPLTCLLACLKTVQEFQFPLTLPVGSHQEVTSQSHLRSWNNDLRSSLTAAKGTARIAGAKQRSHITLCFLIMLLSDGNPVLQFQLLLLSEDYL